MMKTILLSLLALCAISVQAQQTVRPTTADYRYEIGNVGGTYYTNWFIDFHYANLPQGRTYRRQVAEDGNWRFEGAEIVVPEVPGAMASFSDGINLLPPASKIQFFRLVVMPTNSPAMRQQMNLVMQDQPEVRRFFGPKKKKLTKPVTIAIPPNGKLVYRPRK